MVGLLNKRDGLIGVDLGSQCVKLAQVQRRHGGWRLVDAVCVPRRRPWPQQLDRERPLESLDEIRTAVEIGRFRGAAAACLLPRQLTDVRTMALPPGAEGERRAMIAGELESAPGTGFDAPVFDYVEISAELRSRHNALVASASQRWAEQACRDLSAAGLQCRLLDCGPAAISRAAHRAMPSPWAAVDWGFHDVSLTLVVDGAAAFHRLLQHCGVGQILSALNANLQTTDEASQHLACSPTIQSVVLESAEPVLHRLGEQLNQTLQYLQSYERKLAPQRLVLSGGGAAIGGLMERLAELVEAPVERFQAGHLELSTEGPRPPLFGQAVALSRLAWRQP